MRKAKRGVRLRRSRTVFTFILSAGLLLNGGGFLRALAQHSSSEATANRGEPSLDAGMQNASRPRRIDAERTYDDDGPLIRVALMTDVTDVTLSSSSGLIVLRSGTRRDAEKIARRPVRFEIRQQLVRLPSNAAARDDRHRDDDIVEAPRKEYRVEVGTVSDVRQARKVINDLKQRFAEPASSVYDKPQLAFHILIGSYVDRRDATAMIERLRREGYVAARVAPDYATDAAAAAEKPSVTRTTTSKTSAAQREPEPDYRRGSQIVAVEGDHTLA